MANRHRFELARSLALAFVSGPMDADSLVHRGSYVIGSRQRWIRSLATFLAAAFASEVRPPRRLVAKIVYTNKGFQKWCDRHRPASIRNSTGPSVMAPIPAARDWPLPAIQTLGELSCWLGITASELNWLTTPPNRMRDSRKGHYLYRPIQKQSGKWRLIETPKARLKEIQRHILHNLLDRVPVHDAVHGFCPGRSIASFARPHVGKQIVLRVDMQDFFPSIPSSRIQSLFRALGYPEPIANGLTALTTNAVPRGAWTTDPSAKPVDFETYQTHRLPHLPQGAPTSPALANLCAFRLDCRLSRLAESAGATYTRYADDLAFSGDESFGRSIKRFQIHVYSVLIEEGFRPHFHKSKVMRSGCQQRLAGVVVNDRLNVPRKEFDRLKAILTNCVHVGIAGQNRANHGDFRSHLLGRIAFVSSINPRRGERLRDIFNQISW